MLRGELGFDGVVISDALDMHAISRGVGRGPGAVRALAAGVDLLCIGNPCFPEPYDSEAVFADDRRRDRPGGRPPASSPSSGSKRRRRGSPALKERLANAAPLDA